MNSNLPPIMAVTVLYKMPRKKEMRDNFVVESVKELIQTLKLQGITHTSVDYLYAHAQPDPKTGEVLELMAVDNRDKSAPPSNVIPFPTPAKPAETSKPRIKLKVSAMEIDPKEEPMNVVHSYLYSSRQV